jgi:hypothetical protein
MASAAVIATSLLNSLASTVVGTNNNGSPAQPQFPRVPLKYTSAFAHACAPTFRPIARD